MYIEVHQGLRDSPKLLMLSTMLEVDSVPLIGHLVAFWLWCVDHASDGDLDGYQPIVLARAAGWKGDPQVFVDAMIGCRARDGKSGFIDLDEDGMRVHDWSDWAGALVAFRSRRAERRRETRAKAKDAQPSTRPAQTSNAPAQTSKPEQTASTVRANANGTDEELNKAVAALLKDGANPDVLDEIVRTAQSRGRPDRWLPYLTVSYKAHSGANRKALQIGREMPRV